MPTVVVRGGIRAYVNIHEHQPPHVHVDTGSDEVVAYLGEFGVVRYDRRPGVTKRDVRNAITIVEDHLAECWTMWRRYHQ